jgi:hypothetical protein
MGTYDRGCILHASCSRAPSKVHGELVACYSGRLYGEQSILVESCICLVDRIQSTLSKQMLQGIKKGWDALSDRNPDFPHVSLVSSMETCNVCNSALVLETARGRESSDAM